MPLFRSLSAACIALMALAPQARAADVACQYGSREAWGKVDASFAGNWSIAHHAGFYRAGTMVMPFPASPGTEVMGIDYRDNGQLVGTHPEAQAEIPFAWADEPPWSFEAEAGRDGAPAPLLSSTDVETLMGCGVEDLARLIGRTQVTLDGVTMDMTLRLMVVGPDQMYGIFHTSAVANGMPVKSWRAVTMTR